MTEAMKIKEIEELLERYYEGDTSLGEEKQLREFFSSDDVPEQLRLHQPMFRFFADEAAHTLGDDKQENSMKRRIQQFIGETSAVVPHPGKRRLQYLSGIAAGLLLLISLVFVIRNEISKRQQVEMAGVSTEVAYAQATQALMMVSVGLNTGLNSVQRFQTLDIAMEKVRMIHKFYNYQNQFINPERMQTPSTNR